MKPQITIDEFEKVEIRVGKVVECTKVEGSTKLLKLTVDFGPAFAESYGGQSRIIFSGIAQWYKPEEITGRKLAFVVNLAPKKFKINGVEMESQGMIMGADGEEGRAVLFKFDEDVPVGAVVR